MRFSFVLSLCVLVASLISSRLHAQIVETAPRYRIPYREIRTWREQRLVLDRTASQQLDDARRMLSARYGHRGVATMFPNLSPEYLSIPGVEKNLLLSTSDNRNVARGAFRNHRYANAVHNNPQFQLLGVNRLTNTPLGKTDKDIVFRHRASGVDGRIEVKDLSPGSQRRNLAKLKDQVDKMAHSLRTTGEMQCYLNRREIVPELKAHLRARGILSYEHVTTGAKSLSTRGTQSMDRVLADLDQRAIASVRLKMFKSGVGTGFGLYLLSKAILDAREEWEMHQRAELPRPGSVDRLGHHVSLGVVGIGLSTSGLASWGNAMNAETRAARTLSRLGKWGGRIVPVASLAAAYFTYRSYRNGDISRREFVTMQSSLAGGVVGGLGGAWAGAKAGAAVGIWFGPLGAGIGGVIGGITGGFAGGYAGSSATEYGADRYFNFQSEEHERQFTTFVYDLYGTRQP